MLHGAKKSLSLSGPSNYLSAYFRLCAVASISGTTPSPQNRRHSLTPSSITASDDDTWDDDRYKIIAWGLNLVLNLKLTIYIIFIIIKFANFQLSTARFRWQSIYAVFVGILGLLIYLFHEADEHILAIILMGAEVVVSVGICVYVIVVLRRVRRGELQEMKRPGVGEVVVEVELESGRKEGPRQ